MFYTSFEMRCKGRDLNLTNQINYILFSTNFVIISTLFNHP
nr:MAG TPA: hypothetical protein [Caudoviricetes sp.]